MGLVCGCADKKPHPKENASKSGKFEGGTYFSDINDSQTLNDQRFRKQQKIRRTIKFMHPDNPEFRRQLASRFRNPESYKKVLKQIKRRPELAPHFLVNGRNVDGALAGEKSFDRLALGQARSSSVRDEQGESLLSPSLIDQIDFNQLQKAEASIQLPSQEREARQRAFSDSSLCARSSYLRYTFDSLDLQRSSDNDQLRNFKPSLANKNVSKLGTTVDHLHTDWGRKNRWDHRSRVEQAPVIFNVPNYFFKGRVLWTKQEYLSVQKIQTQYKVHQLRKLIRQRIKKRREFQFHKKQLKKMMKKQLGGKSPPKQRQPAKAGDDPVAAQPNGDTAAQQQPPTSNQIPDQPQSPKSDDDGISVKSSELYQEPGTAQF